MAYTAEQTARLTELRSKGSALTDDDLREYIRIVRGDRQQASPVATAKRAPKADKTPAQADLLSALRALGTEMAPGVALPAAASPPPPAPAQPAPTGANPFDAFGV